MTVRPRELQRWLTQNGFNPAHCTGCGQQVGSTRSAVAQTIWCLDPLCRTQPPAGEHDSEDDMMFLLSKAGTSTSELASVFGVTRQRVEQIVKLRSTDEVQRRTISPRG